VSLIAETLPLRSATFILETGTPRTITWQAAGAGVRRLRVAQAHAQEVYGYLIHSCVEFDREGEDPRGLAALRGTGGRGQGKQNFVMLPFAVGLGSVFGALQIESARELEERDIFFIDVVVNQLANAPDRYSSARSASANNLVKVEGLRMSPGSPWQNTISGVRCSNDPRTSRSPSDSRFPLSALR